MDADATGASLDRASGYVARGAILARRASVAAAAGDKMQAELFAREVESMVQAFDALPVEDRESILWVAFTRTARGRKQD